VDLEHSGTLPTVEMMMVFLARDFIPSTFTGDDDRL